MRERIARIAPGALLDIEPDRSAVHGCVPGCVVAPHDAEQAAAVLQLCSEEGWRVECAGGGAWLHAGREPRGVDVVLTTMRMKGVTEYEPADLTLGAQAGTSLAMLQRETAGQGQRLPFDAPDDATLGATIATGSAGPLRLAFGRPRDNVLGLEVVTGDGRILRLGGRVVKNVAGYDVVRLLVGSFGTLGLITRAHVRLRALPEADETHVVDLDLASALETASRAELADPAALEIIRWKKRTWRVAARLWGNADGVAGARRKLQQVTPAFCALDADAAGQFWHSLGEADEIATIEIRLAAPPAELRRTLDLATRIAAESGGNNGAWPPDGWFVSAHATEGVARALCMKRRPGRIPQQLATDVEHARAALREIGGTVHVPTAPALLHENVDSWDVDPGTLHIMQALKRAFDPAGILAPGRWFLP